MSPLTVVVREPGRTPLRLVIDEPLELGRECAGLLLGDPQVSRRHLELRFDEGRVWASDLGSTNGSTVDGQPLERPTPLGPGVVVKIGETTIELAGALESPTDLRSTVLTHLAPREVTPADPTDVLRATSIDLVAAALEDEPPDLSDLQQDHGTLTIVFSDIQDSTRTAEKLGDHAWFDLLSVHNDIVRRRVAQYGGTEVKAQGDGFMLTFPSARRAVEAMTVVQRDFAEHSAANPDEEISIRVGLHIGEVIVGDDGDLFGRHVNFAARVANEAHGGEILVSSLLRQIVDTMGDLEFGEPRQVALKGIAGTHALHPLLWR